MVIIRIGIAAYRDRRLDVSGIGFVFSGRDGFAGIDLDDCPRQMQPETHRLRHFGSKALTYVHRSFALWARIECVVRCRQQFPGVKNSLKGFEAYCQHRFFAINRQSLGQC